MQLDLYTLYLYSYCKEYLFSNNIDIIKLGAFSDTSNCIFLDEFISEEKLADTPIEFFNYLKRRQCFDIKIGKNKKNGIIIECSCRYSLEYWCRDISKEKDGQLVFVKKDELLWATKYRQLTKEDIYNIRRDLKLKRYKE